LLARSFENSVMLPCWLNTEFYGKKILPGFEIIAGREEATRGAHLSEQR